MEKYKKSEEITDDPRYKIANREALIGVAIAIANFLWWFGFAYGLGSKDPSKYHYIFGLPSWFFYSCVLGFVVFTLLVIIVVKFFFTEISIEAETTEEDGGGEDQ